MKFPIPVDYSADNRKSWATNPYGIQPATRWERFRWRTSGYGQKWYGQYPAEIFAEHKKFYPPGLEPVIDYDVDQGESMGAGSELEPLLRAVGSSGNPYHAKPYNPYSKFQLANTSWQEGDFAIDLDKYIHWVKRREFGPRLTPVTEYDFCLVGCQGVDSYYYPGAGAQAFASIAHKLNHREVRNQWNFLLGDNFYHDGVSHPLSPLFQKCFYDRFTHDTQPCFVVAGNHDYNIHSQKRWGEMTHPRMPKIERVMSQVFHSYIKRWQAGEKPKTIDSKWNMPFRYYALTSQAFKVHFITIDSNTIIFDKAQQQWLVQLYSKLAGKYPGGKFILISHHPLKYYSKRKNKGLTDPTCRGPSSPEWKKYVQKDVGLEQRPTYWENFNIDTRGNEIPLSSDFTNEVKRNTIGACIEFLLTKYKLKFDVLFAAHEHLLAYEPLSLDYDGETHTCHQFISGGGGAKLSEPVGENGGATIYKNWGYLHARLKKEAEGRIKLTCTFKNHFGDNFEGYQPDNIDLAA